MKTFTESYIENKRSIPVTTIIWLLIFSIVSLLVPAGWLERVVFALAMTAGIVVFTIQMQRYKE